MTGFAEVECAECGYSMSTVVSPEKLTSGNHRCPNCRSGVFH